MRIDVKNDVINAELSEYEAQILLTIVGTFKNDIPLMQQWHEELLDAGVDRPNLYVVSTTESPVLYFVEDKPQDPED